MLTTASRLITQVLDIQTVFLSSPSLSETGKTDPTIKTAGKHRNIRARKDLEEWLKRDGLPYHSLHKFRHGNAVYTLKNAKDVSALEVASQNLMHANLAITDGMLSQIDVRQQIKEIGKGSIQTMQEDQLYDLLGQLLTQCKKGVAT